jgi:thiol-disulfide isomerase/thioredoxin
MTTGKVILITVLAGTISIGFALFGKQWLEGGKSLDFQLPSLGQSGKDRLDSLPDFRLPDLDGRETSSNDWAGKVLVLNYWATWCPPCLREMPVLAAAQKQHPEVQVVGIAIDAKDDVAAFLAEHQVEYPILIGDTEAIEMSRRLGNRLQGLPFTVIFDPLGKRVHAQIGEVTQASLEKQLLPLLPGSVGRQTAGN